VHEFVEAFKFIAHNGAVAGQSHLPSLTHLALETLKVGAIGVAISIVIAVPVGVGLGHLHRGIVEGFVDAAGGLNVTRFATLADRNPCEVDVVAS